MLSSRIWPSKTNVSVAVSDINRDAKKRMGTDKNNKLRHRYISEVSRY